MGTGLEPGTKQVQHGQPHLDRVVPGGELLAVGHDHVALLRADHQNPQLLAAVVVGVFVGAAVEVSLGRGRHSEGELRRREGPVGRRNRGGPEHFAQETHAVTAVLCG